MGAPVKWILCAGCDEYRLVHPRARSCSARCRARLWRRAHGARAERPAFCAWPPAPLLYLPQERWSSRRRYCHGRCARKAWLVRRARRNLTSTAALEIAIRKLRRSRYPRHLAAAQALAALQQEMTARPTGPDSVVPLKLASIGDPTPLLLEAAG